MSKEKHRLNIALSMDNPLQRDAWVILSQIPSGSRTNALCEALCSHYKQKDFWEAMRSMLREELQSVSIHSSVPAAESMKVEEDDAILNFLRNLQAE